MRAAMLSDDSDSVVRAIDLVSGTLILSSVPLILWASLRHAASRRAVDEWRVVLWRRQVHFLN
jgi:hypothetical protein